MVSNANLDESGGGNNGGQQYDFEEDYENTPYRVPGDLSR